MGNERTCGNCIGFFRRYSKKSKQPSECGHLEAVPDCISCKYARCISMGLSAKHSTSIETDLGSIKSPEPMQTFDESVIQCPNHENILPQILTEFDAKKALILSASDEKTVKDLILQLAQNIGQFLGCLKQNLSNAEIRRHLLIAFVYLFDNCAENSNNYLNFLVRNDLKKRDELIKKQLDRIYEEKNSSKDETNCEANVNLNVDNNNNTVYTNEEILSNNNYVQYSYNQTYFTNYNYNYTTFNQNLETDNFAYPSLTLQNNSELNEKLNLNNLKALHFLLILFASIWNLDLTSSTNSNIENFLDCQKLILAMIDKTGAKKSIRDKIVVSVSELIDFF